jgi:hypothetical protein
VATVFHEKAVIDNMIMVGGLGDDVLTLTRGGGGGRGIYADAHGDVPTTRIWRPSAVMPTRNGKTGKRINVILKNARSLASDEKLENLLLELEATEWDIVVVNETWRLQKEEHFLFDAGHRWIGGGGAKRINSECGKHGVAILLHKRWQQAYQKMVVLSPRLVYVDYSSMIFLSGWLEYICRIVVTQIFTSKIFMTIWNQYQLKRTNETNILSLQATGMRRQERDKTVKKMEL